MNSAIRTLSFALLVLLLVPLAARGEIRGIPRISLAEGDLMFRSAEENDWVPAALNTPLREGDRLWCPDRARAELQLPDGTRVRLDSGAELEIISRDSSHIQLHLSRGRLYLRTSAQREQNLQIDADDTSVLPSARTRLRIDMLESGEEDVSIYKGAAYVEGGGSRTRVRAGEQIVLDDGRAELLPLSPSDEWDSWNREQDRLLKGSYDSGRYLPDELLPYAADFDGHGSWLRVDEYGMVWTPQGMPVDWAPYRVGRWAWLGGDYVWISAESWGWAPHHYGRWVFLAPHGWCWVPPVRGDIFWSPGYVGWFAAGAAIGWIPLAPGEIYIGYGRFGRYSRNIALPGAPPVHDTPAYRNLRHGRGGLTVVTRDNFLKGRIVLHQPPHGGSPPPPIAGRPHLAPERETTMPSIGTPRPPLPEHRKSPSPHDLKQRFPRVVPPPAVPRQPAPQAAPAAPRPPAQPALPPQPRKRVVFPVVPGAEPPAAQPPAGQKPRQPAPPAQPPAAQKPQPPAAQQTRPPVMQQSPQQRDRKSWQLRQADERGDDQQERREQKNEPSSRERGREERRK